VFYCTVLFARRDAQICKRSDSRMWAPTKVTENRSATVGVQYGHGVDRLPEARWSSHQGPGDRRSGRMIAHSSLDMNAGRTNRDCQHAVVPCANVSTVQSVGQVLMLKYRARAARLFSLLSGSFRVQYISFSMVLIIFHSHLTVHTF